MTDKHVTKTSTRKPYTKPRLEPVRLVIEEAVLETCKTGGTGGPNTSTHNCNPGGGGADCFRQRPS